MRKVLLMILIAGLAVSAPAGAGTEHSETAAFAVVDTKTLDKEKFVFPDDVRGLQLNILFLAMGPFSLLSS